MRTMQVIIIKNISLRGNYEGISFISCSAAFCTREDERESINTHHFHHMWEVREHNGPVWKYSGETFESILGILKRLHCPGTRNTPKQIMENHWIHEM